MDSSDFQTFIESSLQREQESVKVVRSFGLADVTAAWEERLIATGYFMRLVDDTALERCRKSLSVKKLIGALQAVLADDPELLAHAYLVTRRLYSSNLVGPTYYWTAVPGVYDRWSEYKKVEKRLMGLYKVPKPCGETRKVLYRKWLRKERITARDMITKASAQSLEEPLVAIAWIAVLQYLFYVLQNGRRAVRDMILNAAAPGVAEEMKRKFRTSFAHRWANTRVRSGIGSLSDAFIDTLMASPVKGAYTDHLQASEGHYRSLALAVLSFAEGRINAARLLSHFSTLLTGTTGQIATAITAMMSLDKPVGVVSQSAEETISFVDRFAAMFGVSKSVAKLKNLATLILSCTTITAAATAAMKLVKWALQCWKDDDKTLGTFLSGEMNWHRARCEEWVDRLSSPTISKVDAAEFLAYVEGEFRRFAKLADGHKSPRDGYLLVEVGKLRTRCKAVLKGQALRSQTPGLLFTGDSHGGKTYLARDIATKLVAVCGGPNDTCANSIYYAPNDTKYFDNYDGQLVFVAEESQTFKTTAGDTTALANILTQLSTSTVVMPMAKLTDKGRLFESKFAIYTSNLAKGIMSNDAVVVSPELTGLFTDFQAYVNRFRLYKQDGSFESAIWCPTYDRQTGRSTINQLEIVQNQSGQWVFRKTGRVWTVDEILLAVIETRDYHERVTNSIKTPGMGWRRAMQVRALRNKFAPPIQVASMIRENYVLIHEDARPTHAEGGDYHMKVGFREVNGHLRTEYMIRAEGEPRAAHQMPGFDVIVDEATYRYIHEIMGERWENAPLPPMLPEGQGRFSRFVKNFAAGDGAEFAEELVAGCNPIGFCRAYGWEYSDHTTRFVACQLGLAALLDSSKAVGKLVFSLEPVGAEASYLENIAKLSKEEWEASLDDLRGEFIRRHPDRGGNMSGDFLAEAYRGRRIFCYHAKTGSLLKMTPENAITVVRWLARGAFYTLPDDLVRAIVRNLTSETGWYSWVVSAGERFIDGFTAATPAGKILKIAGIGLTLQGLYFVYLGLRWMIRKVSEFFEPETEAEAAYPGGKVPKRSRVKEGGLMGEDKEMFANDGEVHPPLNRALKANTLSARVGNSEAYAFAVTPDILALNLHVARKLVRMGPAGEVLEGEKVELRLRRHSKGGAQTFVGTLDFHNCAIAPKYDVIFFNRSLFKSEEGGLPLQPFADLRKHYPTNADLMCGHPEAKVVFRVSPEEKKNHHYNVVFGREKMSVTSKQEYRSPSVNDRGEDDVVYVKYAMLEFRTVPGYPGLCGTPYVSEGSAKILGLHCAGTDGGLFNQSSCSYALPLTAEIIARAETDLAGREVHEETTAQSREIDEEWFVGTKVRNLTRVTPSPVGTYSTLFRSRVPEIEFLGPNDYAPAMIDPRDDIIPIKVALTKFVDSAAPPEVEATLPATVGVLLADVKPVNFAVPSLEDVIKGRPGVCDPVDLNTSGGYNRPKKSKVVRKTEDGLEWLDDAQFKDDLRSSVRAIVEGKPIPNVNQFMLKSELRPKPKAASGNTRLFSTTFFSHFVLAKMVFMVMVNAFKDNATTSFFPYGLDPYRRWGTVDSRTRRHPNVFAGDIERFDKAMWLAMISVAFDSKEHWFETHVRHDEVFRRSGARALKELCAYLGIDEPDMSFEEFHRRAVYSYKLEALNPRFVLGSWAFDAPGVLPSGSFLTYLLGCLCCGHLHLANYLAQGYPLAEFRERVTMVIGSDDHVVSVRDDTTAMNAISMRDLLGSGKMGYTSASKGEVDVPFDGCTEFLKRTPAVVDGVVVGRLDKGSIAKMVYWFGSKNQEDIEQLSRCVALETYYHGQEAYSQVREAFVGAYPCTASTFPIHSEMARYVSHQFDVTKWLGLARSPYD